MRAFESAPRQVRSVLRGRLPNIQIGMVEHASYKNRQVFTSWPGARTVDDSTRQKLRDLEAADRRIKARLKKSRSDLKRSRAELERSRAKLDKQGEEVSTMEARIRSLYDEDEKIAERLLRFKLRHGLS